MKKNRTNKSTHIGQIWTERLLIQPNNKKIHSKKIDINIIAIFLIVSILLLKTLTS